MARSKIFTKMAQWGGSYGEWYPQVRDQADRCIWDGYNFKYAPSDALLYQTDNEKLKKKIITEELDYYGVVRYGLAFEHGDKMV